MGHAAGQPPDRLHLARLEQLFLQVFPVRDVQREREDFLDVTLIVEEHRVVPLAGDGLAAPGPVFADRVAGQLTPEETAEYLLHPRAFRQWEQEIVKIHPQHG